MPIQPFTDRPRINFNYSALTINVATGTMAAGNIDKYKQGISIRTTSDALKKLTPMLSSFGFPASINERVNHQIERTTYGYVELFKDTVDGISITPYDDIATLRDPIKFLMDSGITAYPSVMLSPNWLNPGAMNGIIEPLSVRGTLPGASIDSPFVAHTVRASQQPFGISYLTFKSISGLVNGQDVPFIDSQDISFTAGKVYIPMMKIGDFGTPKAIPYDDSFSQQKKNSLMSQKESLFNDFPGVGIISKGSSTTFNYNSERSVGLGETGIRNVCNVNTLAFGGLLR